MAGNGGSVLNRVDSPAGGSGTGGLTNTELRATAVPVSSASLPLPAGASTETTLAALNAKHPASLSVAPASDTGQTAIPVRVISQLGAGGGGAGTVVSISQTTPGTTNGVAITALTFPVSTVNSSAVQLAAGATFTGTLENVQNLQAAQVQVFSDQPYSVFIEQFIDVAGTKLTASDLFTRLANVPYNENVTVPGNYFRVRVTNTGAAATTTLQIDTTFGIMATGPRTVTALGNNRMALNEVSGAALALGSQLTTASIPVALPSDQIVKVVDTDTIVVATNITTQNLVPTGAATAGSAVEISLNGDATLSTQINGTYTGALSLQVTLNGTVWVTVGGTPFLSMNTATYLASITSALTGIFQAEVAGCIKARITALAAVTGTATVNLQASAAPSMVALDVGLPTGVNIIGRLTANQSINTTQINTTAIATGNGVTGLGVQRVTIASDQTPFPVTMSSAPSNTYAAAATNLAPALTATDIFSITGSATKTIRITKVALNGVQTTGGQISIVMVKRSTANTLGTSTAQTNVPMDSLNVASTATVLAYTANPTTGTLVGNVHADRVFLPGAATASDAQGLFYSFGDFGQQPITLRGVAEVFAINLAGTTITGGSLNVDIEWTES